MIKLLNSLKNLFVTEKPTREKFGDLRQEVLNRAGREQFKKMLERGMSIPVITL